MNKQQPFWKTKRNTIGGILQLAIWDNQTKKGPMKTVSLKRGYRPAGSTEWKNVSSFRTNDIDNLIAMLEEAKQALSRGEEG